MSRKIRALIVASLLLGTFGLAMPAEAAGSTTVALSPASASVETTNSTQYAVVVESADGGVGSLDISVAVADGAVANVSTASITGSGQFETVDRAADNDSVRLTATGMDTADSGAVEVATVTLVGVEAGTTDVSLTVTSLGDENGSAYDVDTTEDATLSVTEPVTETRTTTATGDAQQNSDSNSGSDSDSSSDSDTDTTDETTESPPATRTETVRTGTATDTTTATVTTTATTSSSVPTVDDPDGETTSTPPASPPETTTSTVDQKPRDTSQSTTRTTTGGGPRESAPTTTTAAGTPASEQSGLFGGSLGVGIALLGGAVVVLGLLALLSG